MILLNFKFGKSVVVLVKLFSTAVEKLDGTLKCEGLTFASPPGVLLDHAVRPQNLLDDSTCYYFSYFKMKTRAQTLTVP